MAGARGVEGVKQRSDQRTQGLTKKRPLQAAKGKSRLELGLGLGIDFLDTFLFCHCTWIQERRRRDKKQTRDGGRERGGGGAKDQTEEPKTKDLMRKGPAAKGKSPSSTMLVFFSRRAAL